MSRAFTPRRLLLAVLLVALTALVLLGQSFRVFDRAWFAVQEWRHADAWKERSIWLPDYRVRIEAQPIEGLNDDVSALTFDPDRRTLFTVTNQPAQIIELSLQGKVLRTIPLTGFGDAEAIEYISRGVYVITDERQQRLVKVRLEDDTRFIDAADAQQLSLGIGLNGNKGFEGLAYDAEGKRLFVARSATRCASTRSTVSPHPGGQTVRRARGGRPRARQAPVRPRPVQPAVRRGHRAPAGVVRRVASGSRAGHRRRAGQHPVAAARHARPEAQRAAGRGRGDGRPWRALPGQRTEPVLRLQQGRAGAADAAYGDGRSVPWPAQNCQFTPSE